MASSVFAIQNELALRFGEAAAPNSFLALRLKGLHRNQPDLIAAFQSSTSSSAYINNHRAAAQQQQQQQQTQQDYNNPLRSSIAASSIHHNSNNYSQYQTTTSQQQQQQCQPNSNNYNNTVNYGNNSSTASTTIVNNLNNLMANQPTNYNNMRQQQQQYDFDGNNAYHRSVSGGFASATDSGGMRLTPTRSGNNNNRRSPSRNNNNRGGGRSTSSAATPAAAADDIDAMRLPAPGELSAHTTLAKALSTDPEAQAPLKTVKLAECHICHRRFDVTRLERHITACTKSAQAASKRKEYDAQEMRVRKLYENDPMAADKVLQKIEKEEHLAATGRAPPKKSTWRKRSAELNNAVGRGGGGGVGGGGMGGGGAQIPIADDRVPCPGCGKKFAEETAVRHIPNCLDRQKRTGFR